MNFVEEWMHWNLDQIYLHLKSNTKLTTLPTLCDTGKLEYVIPKDATVIAVTRGLMYDPKVSTLVHFKEWFQINKTTDHIAIHFMPDHCIYMPH